MVAALMCLAVCVQSGCIALHYNAPARQTAEYTRIDRALGKEGMRRVKETPRPLRDEELGGEAARLSGVFVGDMSREMSGYQAAMAAQNRNTLEFSEREQITYPLDIALILDEATLMSRSPQTCIEVVLNTETLYQIAITKMKIELEVDRELVEFELSEESQAQAEFWYRKRYRFFWIHEGVFYGITQRARLCAPVEAREVVSLSLYNDLMPLYGNERWVLAFRWYIEGAFRVR